MRATDVLRSALMGIVEEMGLNWPAKAVIEPPRDPKHGDLAANIAMLLAREAHKNPRELAQIFVEKLPQRCADIEKVEVAGPGFCNVTFSQHFWRKTVCEVEAAGAAYGQSSVGQGRKTLVEYVSANPTGPCMWATAAAPPWATAWPACCARPVSTWRPSTTSTTPVARCASWAFPCGCA